MSNEEFKEPNAPVRQTKLSRSGNLPLLAKPSAPVSGGGEVRSPRKASVPPLVISSSPSKDGKASKSDPGNLRGSLTRSEAPGGSYGGFKGSNRSSQHKPMPYGSSVYSPRWIVAVKRETDRQVRSFLESLMAPEVRSVLREEVYDELDRQGNQFLRLKTDLLGATSKAMVRTLRNLLATANPKEKRLIIQLLLAISSCSRLDEYIESVREAEKKPAGQASGVDLAVGRHGYDGQIEYQKTDSPRLRDSQSKRANFLSQSLNGDEMEAFIQLIPVTEGAEKKNKKKGGEGEGGGKEAEGEEGASEGGKETEEHLLLCRVCEKMIEKSIYEQHIKYCSKKTSYDIQVIATDQEIAKLLMATPPGLQAGSPLRILMEKVMAISAEQKGGFYECMGLKKELDGFANNMVSPGEAAVAQRCGELIAKKIKSLQSAEIAVLQSPRLPSPKLSRTPSTEHIATSAKIPSILDFEILKPITRGGFGGVYLARKKATKDLYAIKALNRKEMIRRGEMKSIFAERNILATVQSEHVVKMFFAMASRRYLFFVMEFMAGGDCFTLLRRFGRFDEGIAKFYIAEVVLALEDLHLQGVIHRDLKARTLSCLIGYSNCFFFLGTQSIFDIFFFPSLFFTLFLKPDNVLIGADGHVKLADFGLSAIGLINKQAREGEEPQPLVKMEEGQVKGTPHYLAPEILLGLPHGQAVDWWALGVMLFEFCNGYPPFNGATVEDVFSEIFANKISWPAPEQDEMSASCKSLIVKLLENEPEKRFGPAVRVKAHPFFVTSDDPDFWLTLSDEEPPFVPTQESAEDTSNFNERIEFFPIEEDSQVGEDDELSRSFESDGGEEEGSRGQISHDTSGNNLTNFWHVNVTNLALKK
jgi:microtubule-associated serine/threonine kinase